MKENVDLTKILKGCPKGWKFWSPIFGEVEFEKIFEHREFVNVKKDKESWSFCSDATFPIGDIKSVEIMLYPSEDQRDWSKFTAPWYKKAKKDRFNPKTLKAFDLEQYGGAPLLGLNGLVVKTHGSSKAIEIKNSILQCITFTEQNINQKIKEKITMEEN